MTDVFITLYATLWFPGHLEGSESAVLFVADDVQVDPNSGGQPVDRPQFCLREVIVKFGSGTSDASRERVVREHGCDIVRFCSMGDFYLLRVPTWAGADEMVEVFQLCEQVEYAELNPYAYAAFVPNDLYYPLQWHLDNPVTGGIGAEEAWDLQVGDPNVIVAVLDTGVAYEDFDIYRQAPDLAGTLFVPGYDFVNDDAHPNDDHGHGTHVTGTIAQSTNNGLGVAGVAFGCAVMPVKVMDANGVGDHFTIASGVLFAVERGARVINLSLGSEENSQTLRDAVRVAYERGVTVVAAVGNGFLRGNHLSYPAAETEYCIGVGAVRYDLSRAPYSTTGKHVAVVAPGGDVSVDQNGDGYVDGVLQQTFRGDPQDFAYWFFQGTSMAVPHVSGVAALLASCGVVHPDRVREAIEMTTLDLGPQGWDPAYGWGLIDAQAALRYHPLGDLARDNAVSP